MPQVDPNYRLVLGPAGTERWIHKNQIAEIPVQFELASRDRERAARADLETGIAEQAVTVADVAMLGIPSALAITAHEALGNEGAAEGVRRVAQRGREAIGPGGEALGLGLGVVGSMPLRGLGLLGRGMRGIGAPIAGIARGGEAAERALAATQLGKMVPALPAIVRGGAEGLAFGGVDAITRSVIEDTELTGEQLAISAGLGAGIGAGATVGLRMLGALARPGKAAFGRAAEKLTGRKGAKGGLLSSAYGSGAGLVSSAKAGDIRGLTAMTPAARTARRRAVFDYDEIIEKTERGLREDLALGQNAYNEIAPAVQRRGGGKAGHYRKQVSTKNPETQRGVLVQEVDDVVRTIDDMADPEKKGFFYLTRDAKDLRLRAIGYRDKLRALSVADGYILVDGLKAEVGNVAAAMGKTAKGRVNRVNTIDQLDTLYHKMRDTLELEDLWGKAAVSQRRVNAPWTTQIQQSHAYNEAITKRVPSERAFRGYQYDVSSDKVSAFTKNITNPAKDDSYQGIVRHLNNRMAWADAVEEAVELTARQKTAVQALKSSSASALKRLKDAGETMAARNTLRGIEAAERRGVGAMLFGAAGLGAYGLAEGDKGLVGAGLLAAALMRPGMVVRQLAAVERMAGGVGGKMGGKLKSFFDRAKPTAERAIRIASIRAYNDRTEALRSHTPEQSADDFKRGLGVLADASPGAVAAAGDAAARRHAYLVEQIPADTSAHMLAPQVAPSRGEIEHFLRKLRAVDDPASLLEDLADGKLRGDDVEAVKQVYPALYQQMRQDVLQRVADMAAEGKQLPYHDRLQLDMLLDLGIEPTLDPELMATLQGLYALPPVPPQQPPRQTADAPDLASAWQTNVQRLESAAEKEI